MKKLATDVFQMKYVNKKCTIDHLQLVAPFDLKYESFNEKKMITKVSTLSNSEVIKE